MSNELIYVMKTFITIEDYKNIHDIIENNNIVSIRLWTNQSYRINETQWSNTIYLYTRNLLYKQYQVITDYKPTANQYLATRCKLNDLLGK